MATPHPVGNCRGNWGFFLATVHEHLQALIKKKVIRKYEGAVRGIELLDKHMSEALASVELPIMGFIAAGKPIMPYTDPDATMRIAPSLVSGKRAFVLQVKGTSMIEEGIFDHDFVVIEEEEIGNVKDGDIVVALLENGLATLKRFFKEKPGSDWNRPIRPCRPFSPPTSRIQGRLKAVIRKY